MFLNETMHPYTQEVMGMLGSAYYLSQEEFYDEFDSFKRRHGFSDEQAARTYAFICDAIPDTGGVPPASVVSRCLWKGIGH